VKGEFKKRDFPVFNKIKFSISLKSFINNSFLRKLTETNEKEILWSCGSAVGNIIALCAKDWISSPYLVVLFRENVLWKEKNRCSLSTHLTPIELS
jgi:hypothetical protein